MRSTSGSSFVPTRTAPISEKPSTPVGDSYRLYWRSADRMVACRTAVGTVAKPKHTRHLHARLIRVHVPGLVHRPQIITNGADTGGRSIYSASPTVQRFKLEVGGSPSYVKSSIPCAVRLDRRHRNDVISFHQVNILRNIDTRHRCPAGAVEHPLSVRINLS
jgi:hypothetical protein